MNLEQKNLGQQLLTPFHYAFAAGDWVTPLGFIADHEATFFFYYAQQHIAAAAVDPAAGSAASTIEKIGPHAAATSTNTTQVWRVDSRNLHRHYYQQHSTPPMTIGGWRGAERCGAPLVVHIRYFQRAVFSTARRCFYALGNEEVCGYLVELLLYRWLISLP